MDVVLLRELRELARASNLQWLTHRENVAKMHRDRKGEPE